MDLRQLQYFLHIAEAGSLSVASDRAHVTQPALSRQLKLLEEEIGCVLFERKARGLQLTDSGERLKERVGIFLADFRRLREEMRAATDVPHGRIVIAIPPSLRDSLTVPCTERFWMQFPGVVIQVMEGMSVTVRDAVLSGSADLAIVSDREPSDLLIRHPLGKEPLVLLGASSAVFKRRRSRSEVSIDEIAALPLVISPHPNSLRRIIEEGFNAAGLTCTPRIEVENSSLALALARSGLVFGILPRCATDTLPGSPRVKFLPIQGLVIGWHIVTARDRPMTSAARRFLEIVRAQASALIARGTWLPLDTGESVQR